MALSIESAKKNVPEMSYNMVGSSSFFFFFFQTTPIKYLQGYYTVDIFSVFFSRHFFRTTCIQVGQWLGLRLGFKAFYPKALLTAVEQITRWTHEKLIPSMLHPIYCIFHYMPRISGSSTSTGWIGRSIDRSLTSYVLSSKPFFSPPTHSSSLTLLKASPCVLAFLPVLSSPFATPLLWQDERTFDHHDERKKT